MAEKRSGDGHDKGEPQSLLQQAVRVAGLEAQLVGRYVKRTARETAKGVAQGVLWATSGVAVGLVATGTLGVATGLALAHRRASGPTLAGITLGALSAGLIFRGLHALPTEALDELRTLLRSELLDVRESFRESKGSAFPQE